MKGWARKVAAGVLWLISGAALAGNPGQAPVDKLALSILQDLEVNSFENSLRPAHYPPGTTLGQTPYRVYEKVAASTGAYLARDAQGSWLYSVRVLEAGEDRATICFVDQNPQGGYLAASRLQVRRNLAGHYVVVRSLPAAPACVVSRG
ncbi:hypothetical protein [Pseudomonas sp. microsymbiont 2]